MRAGPGEIGFPRQATSVDQDLILPKGAGFVDPQRRDWITLDLVPAAEAPAGRAAPAPSPGPPAREEVASKLERLRDLQEWGRSATPLQREKVWGQVARYLE